MVSIAPWIVMEISETLAKINKEMEDKKVERKPVLTEDERRQFKNFRDQHPELNFDQAHYRFYKSLGKLKSYYTPHNSREKGYKPEMFAGVIVEPDKDSKYGYAVYDCGRYKKILEPKESSSTRQHLYAYVHSSDGISRIMSLAALVWLCYMRKEIPAGYVVDHIDDNPFNNEPKNLQILTIGDNVRKNKKGTKNT